MERGGKASHEFYHACLDRIDILITEKGSSVDKEGVVKILRDIAYFRPRDYHREDKQRKEQGFLSRSEM